MSALDRLAEELRSEEVIAPHVRDSAEEPALGLLAASGPRATGAADDYVLLFEAIREGYLLHYAEPRLMRDADPDLRLLAGDYLYALGLRRLAARGDMDAVRELGDLISLSAQLHARSPDAGGGEALDALWLASAVAVANGADRAHEAAKQAIRDGDPKAAGKLMSAVLPAAQGDSAQALARAAESIGFAAEHLPHRG